MGRQPARQGCHSTALRDLHARHVRLPIRRHRGPIYWTTQDALLAWQVGIGAGFHGRYRRRDGRHCRTVPEEDHATRAGMLGTLCGIALVFIGSVPLTQVFENPIVGFAALVIILWGLIGRFRLPMNIPCRSRSDRRRHGDRDHPRPVELRSRAVSASTRRLPYIGDLIVGRSVPLRQSGTVS